MKPNNDKPPTPPGIDKALGATDTKRTLRNLDKGLSWLCALYVGFILLLALNYAWLGFARSHGYYSHSLKPTPKSHR